ncbi:MAG: general secretion pathway protein C [Comamonadaceae bacterium]|nr:MAG: general secretion pathway protein C [Comamonadaceae bacterium]
MVTPMQATWTVRGATFALWLLAAGCAAFWGLRLGGSPAADASAPAGARATVAVEPAAIARLLGGGAAPVAVAGAPVASLASRFQLVGIAARVGTGTGAAIIAVDGRPARPYRVGAVVDEGLVLQSVQARQALLGPLGGVPALTLELPPLRR